MDLYDVLRTTGAVRRFTDDPLPDADLHTILDSARFAPSGGNRQGTHVVVVRDRATRERLVELCSTGGRRYAAQGAHGEAPWNPLHPPGPSAEEIAGTEVPEHLTRPLLEAPVLLVICLDLAVVAAMDQDLDRVGVVSGASVYPLAWNILLAARNEGYGGTFNTMAIPEEPAIRELLGIPRGFAVAALLPLGRPVKQVSRLKRQPVEDFCTRERFDGAPFEG